MVKIIMRTALASKQLLFSLAQWLCHVASALAVFTLCSIFPSS